MNILREGKVVERDWRRRRGGKRPRLGRVSHVGRVMHAISHPQGEMSVQMKGLEGSDAAWTARITRAWRTADKVLRKWWGQIRHGVEICGRHVFMNHVAFQSLHSFSNTTLLAVHSSSCPSLWLISLGIMDKVFV